MTEPSPVFVEPRARAAEQAVTGVRGPAIEQTVAGGVFWQQAHLNGDRGAFLNLGEPVLDTPRLQVFGYRHR